MANDRPTLARRGLRHPRLAALGERAVGCVLTHVERGRYWNRRCVLAISLDDPGRWLVFPGEQPMTPPEIADAGWMLDLDSPATAGVLWETLPAGMRVEAMLGRVAIWHHGDPRAPVYRGQNLAEAALAALLAIEPVEVAP